MLKTMCCERCSSVSASNDICLVCFSDDTRDVTGNLSGAYTIHYDTDLLLDTINMYKFMYRETGNEKFKVYVDTVISLMRGRSSW